MLEAIDRLTSWRSNTIEQSPWGDDSRSAGQEIPRLLWSPEFHYRVHKCPKLDGIPRQFNPVHYIKLYLRFIITPSRPGSLNWSLSFSFADQNFVYIYMCVCLPHACYMSRPPHSSIWSPYLHLFKSTNLKLLMTHLQPLLRTLISKTQLQ
jgi:hypothetical protein